MSDMSDTSHMSDTSGTSDLTSRPLDLEIASAGNATESVTRRAEGASAPAPAPAPARMTGIRAIRGGLAQAGRSVRLVLVVWFAFLTLAWVAALPAWRWWDRMLSLAPEGDRLLSGLNVALLRELSHYDRSPTVAIALGATFTFLLFALIMNPFVAGGTLGVLQGTSPSSSPSPAASPSPWSSPSSSRGAVRVTRRFVGEGVRWYWPFARILLIVGLLGAGITMVLMAGFEAVGAAFEDRGMSRASMWVDNVMLLTVAIVFGVSSLIVDIARIFTRRRDDRRTVAAVRQALGFIFGNVGAVVVIGVTFVVMVGAAVVVYNLIASGITPLSWGLIAFTILWQQLFALARTALRVGLLASLVAIIDARVPPPVDDTSAPADVTAVDEPVYELPMLG